MEKNNEFLVIFSPCFFYKKVDFYNKKLRKVLTIVS